MEDDHDSSNHGSCSLREALEDFPDSRKFSAVYCPRPQPSEMQLEIDNDLPNYDAPNTPKYHSRRISQIPGHQARRLTKRFFEREIQEQNQLMDNNEDQPCSGTISPNNAYLWQDIRIQERCHEDDFHEVSPHQNTAHHGRRQSAQCKGLVCPEYQDDNSPQNRRLSRSSRRHSSLTPFENDIAQQKSTMTDHHEDLYFEPTHDSNSQQRRKQSTQAKNLIDNDYQYDNSWQNRKLSQNGRRNSNITPADTNFGPQQTYHCNEENPHMETPHDSGSHDGLKQAAHYKDLADNEYHDTSSRQNRRFSKSSRRHSTFTPVINNKLRRYTVATDSLDNGAEEDNTSLLAEKRRNTLAAEVHHEAVYDQIVNQQNQQNEEKQVFEATSSSESTRQCFPRSSRRHTYHVVPPLQLGTTDSTSGSQNEQEPSRTRTRNKSLADSYITRPRQDSVRPWQYLSSGQRPIPAVYITNELVFGDQNAQQEKNPDPNLLTAPAASTEMRARRPAEQTKEGSECGKFLSEDTNVQKIDHSATKAVLIPDDNCEGYAYHIGPVDRVKENISPTAQKAMDFISGVYKEVRLQHTLATDMPQPVNNNATGVGHIECNSNVISDDDMKNQSIEETCHPLDPSSSIPNPPSPPPIPESAIPAADVEVSPATMSFKTQLQMLVAIKRLNRKRELKKELKNRRQSKQVDILSDVVKLDDLRMKGLEQQEECELKTEAYEAAAPCDVHDDDFTGSQDIAETEKKELCNDGSQDNKSSEESQLKERFQKRLPWQIGANVRRFSATPKTNSPPRVAVPEPTTPDDILLDEISNALSDAHLGHRPSDMLSSSDTHFAKVGKFLLEMYTHDRMTDVVVKVGSYSFSAHQAVLASHSHELAQQLVSTSSPDYLQSQKQIVLHEDVTSVAFQILLQYMYSGKLHASVDTLAEVLRAAVCLHLSAVEEHCRHYLENLSLEEILSVLETAHKQNIDDVMTWALKRAAADFVTVAVTERFLQLDVESVLTLLVRDDLFVSSEYDVAEAAVNWLDYSQKHRRIYLRRLLSCVRFPRMSTRDLLRLSRVAPYLQDDDVISAKMLEANWYRSFVEVNLPPPSNIDVPAPRLSACHSTMDSFVHVPADMNSHFTDCRCACSVHSCRCESSPDVTATPVPPSYLVFAVGGYNPDSENPNLLGNGVYQCENMQSNWCQVTELPEARVHHAVAMLGDLLYVIGGCDPTDQKLTATSTVYCYNPVTMEWSTRRSMNLGTPRMYHCATTMDNKIYVIGGQDQFDTILSSVECYDPNKRTWRPVPPMVYRRIGASVVVYEHVILVAGGYGRADKHTMGPNTILKSVEYFQTHTRCWTEVTPLSAPRCFASMGLVGDGMLICGGLTPTSDKASYNLLSAMELYSQKQESWEPLGKLNQPSYDAGSVVLGDTLFMIGGLVDDNQTTANVEAFDGVSRCCTSAGTFLHSSAGMQCVVWEKKK